CWDAYNPGIPTLPNFPSPLQDTDPILKLPDGSPFDNKDNVSLVSAATADGVTTVVCERDLTTGDILDSQLRRGRTYQVWGAYNEREIFGDEDSVGQPMWTSEGATTWRP
ncbi:MAG: hypothetical protein HQ526_04600, partial [Actinobacteria bacterium]|nr:hypothetical protein [Actinomycetota bacterium]